MKGGTLSGRLLLALVVAFFYLPILVLAIYSFNESRFGMAWEGFTLRWYAQVFRSPEVRSAVNNTLVVSLTSTMVATVLGALLGIGLHLYSFRGRRLVDTLIYLPVIVPDIILGVALLGFYVAVHLTLGRLSIILAHIAFQISFVALVVRARLQAFPVELLEAARDLGAGPYETLRRVILPLSAPGIVGGALIAFTLSVDDFLITYFTAGAGASTLPLRIYSMVKRGVTPEVNAVSTLLLIFTLLTLSLGLLLLRRRDAGAPTAELP